MIRHKLDETIRRARTGGQHACKPIDDKRGTIEYRTKAPA